MVITNHPQDITVCANQFANIPCGFTGADPNVEPKWAITMRNKIGIISTIRMLHNRLEGLKWIPDLTNTNNSVLRVGPVDETDNYSTYKCIFQIGNVQSSTGKLTVLSESLHVVSALSATIRL